MILRKWNYKSERYEKHEIPDEWNVALFENDMDKLINCADCGKKIKYGEGYTSRDIHTHIGLGYCVCKDCYFKR